MRTYHCKACSRPIFREADLLAATNLWDLGEYQAEAYVIRGAIDQAGLRRYDVSLHEGWYCCRFVMMRMTVDKFGTGDALLVYKDAVVAVEDGATPPVAKPHGAIALTARDHDAVVAAPENRGKLVVVKHGAIWCPPCRLMDAVIDRLVAEEALPDVVFYDLDIDGNPAVATRWRNQSIPFTVFYRDGRQVAAPPGRHPVVDGGVVGGLQRAELVALCEALLAKAPA